MNKNTIENIFYYKIIDGVIRESASIPSVKCNYCHNIVPKLSFCGECSHTLKDNEVFKSLHMVYLPGDGKTEGFYMSSTPVTEYIYYHTMHQYHPDKALQRIDSAVECSYIDAIFFCNNQSNLEGYDLVYALRGEKGIVINLLDADEVESFIGKDFRNPDFWKKNLIIRNNSNGYRLPTVAEYIYAATGCNEDSFRYAGSDNLNDICRIREYDSEPVVTRFQATKQGIYNLTGLVWQFCEMEDSTKIPRKGGSRNSEFAEACEIKFTSYVDAFKEDAGGIRLVRKNF